MNPFRSIFLFTYAFSSKKKNSLLFNAPKNFREKRETRKNRYTCWSNKWNNSFSRNQYDGLNTKATKKSKQTTESLYYKKKKTFQFNIFPSPFYFHRGKTCFHVFFFFFSFTRLKASRSTAKPFPFWRIKPVFFNQHEDKHVNVFNLFEKKWNKIPLLLFRSFDDSKGAPHPQLENGRKISITSSRLPRFLSEVEPLCPNN